MKTRLDRLMVDRGLAESREKAQALAEQGARVHESPRALAHDSGVVLSMLSDDAAVKETLLGSESALGGMRAGTFRVEARGPREFSFAQSRRPADYHR